MYSPVALMSENNPKLFNSVHELVICRTKPIAFSKFGFKSDLPSGVLVNYWSLFAYNVLVASTSLLCTIDA